MLLWELWTVSNKRSIYVTIFECDPLNMAKQSEMVEKWNRRWKIK
jgi:hypothetical protein